MCGIAGAFSSQREMFPEWIQQMTDVMRHRGPDDEGFLAVQTKTRVITTLAGKESTSRNEDFMRFSGKANLFLGHRRLSILDVSSRGHQPMGNADGSLWIVFNGEIYNYREIRETLKGKGVTFHTETDTEVLLAAYQEWGEGCLDKLNGMWSFVVYDKRKNILFGARDRAGVKPFYYYSGKGYLAFASEQKALLTLPFVPRKINEHALYDYLILGKEEQEEEGFFQEIYELLPSHSFQFNLNTNQLQIKKYYQLEYSSIWSSFQEKGFEEYRAETCDLLLNAVKLRLRADVPVGTCLSGGMDSSSIVCIINRLLKEETINQVGSRQKAFTACYEGLSIDESRWAKLVVEHTNAEWFKTSPTDKSLLEDLGDMVRTQDVPFGSTSIYAQYRVMRLARESGVKVVLDGQGADELFTGYSVYYGGYYLEMLRNGQIPALLKELSSLGNAPLTMKAALFSLLRIFGAGLLPPSLTERFYSGKCKALNEDFAQRNKSRQQSIQEKSVSSLNEMLYKMQTMSLKTLLRYEDRNSMRFSIESRTPFADDIHLVERLFSIPSSYKIHHGWSKYLLREAMQGYVPDEIRYRKDKIGFATPENDWLMAGKNELQAYFTDDLKEYLNLDEINDLWNNLQSGSGSGRDILWRLINFAIWKKAYNL